MGLVAALYILTNIAYFGAVTKAELVEEAGTTVATFFFRKVFGEHVAANRVLPGFIALSSLGNIIVVTFIASRVKAEIAKEGIIPFPHFFAANTPTLLSRLLSKSSRSGMGENDQSHHFMAEQTPAGALLLHWAFSIIIVLAPPVSIAYGFFVNLYSYTVRIYPALRTHAQYANRTCR